MKKVGIVCDMEWPKNNLFKNFYFAIEFLYGNITRVTTVGDLEGLDILFVADNDYAPNKDIIGKSGFVEKCNADKIKAVVFTCERTFDSFFPWNVDNYNSLRKFDQLYNYMIDVDDCIKTGAKNIRLTASKHFKDPVPVDVNKKLDKIIFTGQLGYSYDIRGKTLNEAVKLMPIKIKMLPPTIILWKDYIKMISTFRFVLCLKGNANGFSPRFYDTLLAKSIPVQQIEANTLSYHKEEAEFEDCIFFQDVSELPEKISNFKLRYSHNELWMEDQLEKLFKEEGLL